MSNLNIVNEKGEIIGVDTRENIHKNGLLHKEINVWFYTPKREIIFQLRGKHKDTFPNLLDATVGGHVEIGDDFIDTAIKEVSEETGLMLTTNDLHLVKKFHIFFKDSVTGVTNNVIKVVYAYRYDHSLDGLKAEGGAVQSFEAWNIDRLLKRLSGRERKRFLPSATKEDNLEIYREISKLIDF